MTVLNERTDNAIRQAWEKLRPECKNDKSCCVKVTRHINDNKLSLRRLSLKTVYQRTIQLKLRKPFKRGTITPPQERGNGQHIVTAFMPTVNLNTVLMICDTIRTLPKEWQQVILNHIQKEVES